MTASTNQERKVTISELEQKEEQRRAAAQKDREAKFREAWKVPRRYKVKQLLGSGAYGNVAEAWDRELDKPVAIKQTRHLLDDLIDAKRILREAAILGHLNHPNICRIYDIVVPNNLLAFNELYMVLEMCDSDLKKLCRAQVHLEPLHVTTLLYNLLVGLNYLHSAGIWHRDLKPANCLVDEDCTVKICDFGLSRAVGGDFKHLDQAGKAASARSLTGHVVTRWYRAPELILLQESYTEAIDMWSVGCIYAELLGMLTGTEFKERSPLFPGHTCFPLSPDNKHKTDTKYYTKGTHDQLSMICALIGTPSEQDVEQLEVEDARCYMRCFSKKEGSGVRAKFAHIDNAGPALLEHMLVFSAARRVTVADALRNTLFAPVRSRSREFRATEVLSLDFEHHDNLDEKALRQCFLRQVRRYHPEVPEI